MVYAAGGESYHYIMSRHSCSSLVPKHRLRPSSGMSALTVALLNRKPPRNVRRWQKTLAEVAGILVPMYGAPNLGNYRDPVREIYYILLSAKTTEGLYRAAYRRLWRRFPTLGEIAGATVAQIQSCIEGAGLGAKRALQAKQIAQQLLADFGPCPQRDLRRMPLAEAYQYLVGLPGVGPKSALCVLMYCFDADVFPVDANVHRILCRMGAIRPGSKHYQAQERIPAYVPDGLSKALHVVLVVHGRVLCRPTAPRCMTCPIGHLCKTGRRARKRNVTCAPVRKSGIADSAERSS